MRTITRLAISTLMACGAAVAVAAPATAGVRVGVGVGVPVVPAYSCYDGYGNYIYSYPYCTAYAAPVEPYFSFGIGGGHGHRDVRRGFEGGYDRQGGYDRGHVAIGGGGHTDRHNRG